MVIARVIVDIASSLVDKIFDYALPNENFVVGQRVLVPFGRVAKEGYIVEIADHTNYDMSKLKTVYYALEPFPVILKEQLELAKFMKRKFHTGLCDAIRLFLPAEMRSAKVKELVKTNCFIEDDAKAKEYLSKTRKNATAIIGIINYLFEKGSDSQTNINKLFSSSALKKLIDDGVVKTNEVIIS